jgi:hypothetical protein
MESDRYPTRSRILTHGDARFTWMQGQRSAFGHVRIKFHQDTTCRFVRTKIDSSQLIPANRPGLEVARWVVNARTDDLILEIFQEAPIESGLLDAIVLSVVLLRSGHSLGDSSRERERGQMHS